MPDQEDFVDLHFPKAGVDLSAGFGKQPNRPAAEGVWSRTTPVGVNVRSYDPTLNRSRGGSRPGLARYINAQVAGRYFVVQRLAILSGSDLPGPGGSVVVQSSQSGRVVTIVAVSRGRVFTAVPGGTTWTEATNATPEVPPLNFTGVLFSAVNVQKLWFADGINYVYFDPLTNTVKDWVATAGELPRDAANNFPRLICTWRGRTVLSGLLDDPTGWFMSRISVPTDFDYSPNEVSPDQAVAGSNAPQGLLGDPITSLVPYSDDVLIFGGDHTIHLMRGDPMAGGQIDLVTDQIGFAFGEPWCRDPEGVIYFFSNRGSVFAMTPGSQPVRIGQPIEQLSQAVNTGDYTVRMAWDDRFQGFHTFVTPTADNTGATHFFYEKRSGAWWTDTFRNPDHDPLTVCVLDGNRPEDRVPLLGSWDGYVRAVDRDAVKDDGFYIDSEVWIGPLLTKDMDDVLMKDVQALLGAASGDVTYAIHVGRTAEEALESTAVSTGTFAAGRNNVSFVRRSGHALYVKLTSTNRWAMEQIRVRLATTGKVRRRGR